MIPDDGSGLVKEKGRYARSHYQSGWCKVSLVLWTFHLNFSSCFVTFNNCNSSLNVILCTIYFFSYLKMTFCLMVLDSFALFYRITFMLSHVYRTPVIELIMDELSYHKDKISPFLQVWILEFHVLPSKIGVFGSNLYCLVRVLFFYQRDPFKHEHISIVGFKALALLFFSCYFMFTWNTLSLFFHAKLLWNCYYGDQLSCLSLSLDAIGSYVMFLQAFDEPKLKLEIVSQYIQKYNVKVSPKSAEIRFWHCCCMCK